MFRAGIISLVVLMLAGCGSQMKYTGPGTISDLAAARVECARIDPCMKSFDSCLQAKGYARSKKGHLDASKIAISPASHCGGGGQGFAPFIKALGNINKQQPSSNRPVAFFQREYTSGFNKICVYDRLGSEEAYNYKATDLCPQTR